MASEHVVKSSTVLNPHPLLDSLDLAIRTASISREVASATAPDF
jgi:hypothetical protein